MATYIKVIKDLLGNVILPKTNTDAVYLPDNTLLTNKLNSIEAEIADLDLSADNVIYDNTESELSAVNVQDAIDELVIDIQDAGTLDVTDELGTNPLARNADTLNSESPSYYLDSANHFYDNTDSGLSAIKVQNAIDEIVADINSVEEQIDEKASLSSTPSGGEIFYSGGSDNVLQLLSLGNSGQVLISGETKPRWATIIELVEQSMTLALSDETTILTTGTAKLTFRAPFAMELTRIPRASLNVASTDMVTHVIIKKNGVSIFNINDLSIDQNETTSKTAVTPAVLSTTSIADDDILTFDIDKIGTTAKGLKVTLYYRRV